MNFIYIKSLQWLEYWDCNGAISKECNQMPRNRKKKPFLIRINYKQEQMHGGNWEPVNLNRKKNNKKHKQPKPLQTTRRPQELANCNKKNARNEERELIGNKLE